MENRSKSIARLHCLSPNGGVLGGLHTYAVVISQSMNADGTAYLDIGDAYFHADWAHGSVSSSCGQTFVLVPALL
ncbi:MAG TPA: hypothetical protein VF896_07990 [Anaerolineales bacterium]